MAVIVGLAIAFTTGWFEGRMLSEGEMGADVMGGDAICCDARRDGFLDVRRGDEVTGRGEGGTEFRSGAIVACSSLAGLVVGRFVVVYIPCATRCVQFDIHF